MKKIFILFTFFVIITFSSTGQKHVLFGMTAGYDEIYKFDPVTDSFSIVHSFDTIDGVGPCGNLIQASNGLLYGITESGGANNMGVMFRFNPVTNKLVVLINFNGVNGKYPYGGLIQASNGLLYGMTSQGGSTNDGVIYRYNISSGKDSVVFSFDSLISGAQPMGSLVDPYNGPILYGLTSTGGPGSGNGVLFAFDISNNQYLMEANSLDGVLYGRPTLAIDSCLYGMSYGGGIGYGQIFKFNLNTSVFSSVLSFNQTNGQAPNASLVQAPNGILYGMTPTGGVNSDGVLFGYNPITSKDSVYIPFDYTDGFYPTGSLTLDSANGLLYGTTEQEDIGFFSFDPNTGKEDTTLPVVLDGVSYGDVLYATIPSCTNIYDQNICIVTTDTSINKNIIIWGRNNMPPDSLNSFVNIYDSTASGWINIGSVSDTALSEFIDTASNPNLQSYSYRISTVDTSCGESSLSPTNSTVYLQVAMLSNRDSLYWTPYVGFATPKYLIYRGLSLNALTLIDSVSGGTFNYVDTLSPAGSIYLVEAINPSGGCVPTHRRIMHSYENGSSRSLSNGGIPKKVTGIASITSPVNSVRIIPNPNNGKFTIQLLGVNGQSSVEVYNMLGEKVYSQGWAIKNGQGTIDLSDNANGIYLYRITETSGELIGEGKLVIQK
jgi:uncharacterized repeat protein (TIGR03803 family)